MERTEKWRMGRKIRREEESENRKKCRREKGRERGREREGKQETDEVGLTSEEEKSKRIIKGRNERGDCRESKSEGSSYREAK